MPVLSPCGWSADAQAQSAEQKNLTVPQLNKLISEIHSDLMLLKDKYERLYLYSEKSFYGGNDISCMLEKKDSKSAVRYPDQLHIYYRKLSSKDKDESLSRNALKDEESCKFPTLNSEIYAEIFIRNKKDEDEQLIKDIKDIIIKICNILQKEIKDK